MRSGSLPASAKPRIRRRSARDTPMSCTPVRPFATAAASARSSASARRASSGCGTTASTSAAAVSMNTPVALPASSRRMRPPSGCQSPARSRSTARSAALLAQPACPSTRSSQTGRSGKAVSRSAAVGNCLPGQSFWSQPRPSSQAPSGRVASKACRRRMTSSLLAASTRSARSRAKPRFIRWAWASTSPGTTVASPASWRIASG